MKRYNDSLRFFIAAGLLCICFLQLSAQEHTRIEGRHFWQSMIVDGYERSYLINLPPVYEHGSDSLALVIGLHGAGGSAALFERQYHFSEKADKAGFIAVYPNGIKKESSLAVRTWNAGGCCDFAMRQGVDDVKFISRLIDTLVQRYRINPRKVFVTGMSNGGMLAYRLAAELPFKISAIAPVACTMVYQDDRPQLRAVPIMHFHSVRDKIVPYKGTDSFLGYVFPAVDSTMSRWAKRNGCAMRPRESLFKSGYRRKEWLGSSGEPLVTLYVTEDGGHSWPGGDRTRPGAQAPSTLINANDLMWEFFRKHPLP